MARQLVAPSVQQRTFVAAARNVARATAVARPALAGLAQQVRGVKTIDFAGHKEDVYGESVKTVGILSPRCHLWHKQLLTICSQSVPTGPRRSFL